MSEDDPRYCIRCGRELTEPEYAVTDMCGDCYWDDQTDADGEID